MYFNYTKYNPIVFQLQNTNYFCQGHKTQNTLNVFKIHVFQLLVFQLLQHCPLYMSIRTSHGSLAWQSNMSLKLSITKQFVKFNGRRCQDDGPIYMYVLYHVVYL